MITALFSGQGSQYPGMGVNLVNHSSIAKKIYEEAADTLHFDLLNATATDLNKTEITQPAIVTYSYALWQDWLSQKDLNPNTIGFAGFSLGEYSAMGAAGILPLKDLLLLTKERAKVMQEACEKIESGMAAVIGLESDEVVRLLEQFNSENPCYAVNFNTPTQTVIAGPKSTLTEASAFLKTKGAKLILPLKVAGAFHTPYMAAAAENLEAFARQITFQPTNSTFYSNFFAAPIPNDQDWPAYLAKHMTSPVYWTKEVLQCEADGADEMYEFGPGKVLSGLVKKISPKLKITAMDMN